MAHALALSRPFNRPPLLRWAFVVLALVTAMALAGCIAVAAGAGAGVVAYVRGDLETTVAEDFNPVVEATRSAIRELEFSPISDRKDAFKASIIARTALDKKIEITLTNAGKNLTNIKIRVDLFGDEQLSMAILDRIKGKL